MVKNKTVEYMVSVLEKRMEEHKDSPELLKETKAILDFIEYFKTDRRTYGTWNSMRHRCSDKKHHAYMDYGGRGIRVCERWQKSYRNFHDDMGIRPIGMTIERINVNGNYEPDNCRWATPLEQSRNQRKTIKIEYKGESKMISEWAVIFGISTCCMRDRVRQGWSLERIEKTIPKKPSGKDRQITYNGITKRLSEWARHIGIQTTTLSERLRKGWTIEEALTKPLLSFRKNNYGTRI